MPTTNTPLKSHTRNGSELAPRAAGIPFAAKAHGCSRDHLDRLSAAGTLKANRVGRRWRLSVADLDRLFLGKAE